MSDAPLDLAGLGEQLAPHATSATPVWVWSTDGTRILWTNAVGAALFGATPAALRARRFPADDPVARQIAQMAAGLSPGRPPRLQRLRGFGAGLGRMLLCGCSRISLDHDRGVLIAAMEAAGPALPLAERVRRLYDGCDQEIAAFAPDGALLFATAQQKFAGITMQALDAEGLAAAALMNGQAAGDTALGPASLHRIGSGASTVLVVRFAPAVAEEDASPAAEAPPATAAEITPQETAPGAAPPAEERSADASAPDSEPDIPLMRIDVPLPERRYPLRFVWQMDAQGHFTLGSEEFTEVIGPRIAVALGRPWQDVAADLALDPDGQVLRAVATRDTWSGITVSWPVDGSDERLAVELSGLPIYDRDRTFVGYRGFGVCRDIARIASLSRMRRPQMFTSAPPPPSETARSEDEAASAPGEPAAPAEDKPAPVTADERPAPVASPAESGRPSLTLVPPAKNVVPFRASGDGKDPRAPALSPVEHSAFRELGRQLNARLSGDEEAAEEAARNAAESEHPLRPVNEQRPTAWDEGLRQDAGRTASDEPEWRRSAPEHVALLDRLPVGILVYRFEDLLYANQAFLDATGYASMEALVAAGGLDCLFIEGEDHAEPGEAGRPLVILTRAGDRMPVAARLFSIPWNGEKALVLMLAISSMDDRHKTAEAALRRTETQIRELRAILDTATDGVLMLDREGRILAGNRSAEALFGYAANELAARPFADLFAPESRSVALDYLARLARSGGASLVNDGREVIGRVRQGGHIPLFMTLGPAADTPDRFCAVFRDLTAWKKADEERAALRSQAEQASAAKAEFLGKISHEVRTPLNSIVGFSEIMLEEKYGPVGNERYRDYLKDIRDSGAHVASVLNDMLDLSEVEAGTLELTFVTVDLNVIVQGCVKEMQPQANRERIIIRTSLSANLKPIVADARSLHQIILNLLANAIKFAGPGGQVIVSTGATDKGGVVLRVRDTGMGMSGRELESALAPFRHPATAPAGNGAGIGLPLTKALAEANRGTFHIVSKVNDGTLVEIAFPPNRIPAE